MKWAIKLSNGGYIEIGSQISTKDGIIYGNAYIDDIILLGSQLATRIHGNAYIDDIILLGTLGHIAMIITDNGFYPPAYIIDVVKFRC